MLAERFRCRVEELEQQGFEVLSAGVAALPGDAASPGSVAVAEEYGMDLRSHRSRAVHPEMLRNATDILTMTASHAMILQMRYPGEGPPPELLAGPDQELPDPFGGDLSVYRECAAAITQALEQRMNQWVPSAVN
jgi:protein-tyrosine phosphatase